MSEAAHAVLFASAETAPRRHTDTTKVLGAQMQQHSVPMLVGTGPTLVLVSGAAATLWYVGRRQQLSGQ